jgi:hypothetical protein
MSHARQRRSVGRATWTEDSGAAYSSRSTVDATGGAEQARFASAGPDVPCRHDVPVNPSIEGPNMSIE